MAVDETLMEWAGSTGGCCLRFYRWQEPTLSLGYFQVYEDRKRHAASLDCPAVRRVSGGGAIVHDVELTYSMVLPRSHPLAQGRLGLYKTVHATLVEVLLKWGIEASLCGGEGEKATSQQPFLCFERRSPGDVLVGETKVAGSAQRRSAGAVLQHGSVLLARSAAAPELEGLAEVGETPIEGDQLVRLWLENLGGRLGLAWEDRGLARPERRRAAGLMKEKFGADSWTIARGR